MPVVSRIRSRGIIRVKGAIRVRYRKVYMIVAVFTFVLGLSASATWYVLRSRAPKTATSSPTAAGQSFPCDLLTEPNAYISKLVHVRAIVVGFHQLAVYDPTCNLPTNSIRADFDSAARGELINSVEALKGSTFQRGNFWVEVTLFGRLETVEDSGGDTADGVMSTNALRISNRYRLVVSHIENAQAVSSQISWPE